MTPFETKPAMKDIQLAFSEFANTIGSEARAVVVLNNSPSVPPLHVSLYKTWPRGDSIFQFNADNFGEALTELEKRWTAYHEKEGAELIKVLALEIIRVTDIKGKCLESDLRLLRGITANDIAEFSEAACAMADEMAGKGPFTIEKGAKGNAP